jgi:NADH-quinone oxidoreductase subunit N
MNIFYLENDFVYSIVEVYLIYIFIVLTVYGLVNRNNVISLGERVLILVCYLVLLGAFICLLLHNTGINAGLFVFEYQMKQDILFKYVLNILFGTLVINIILAIDFIKKDTLDGFEYIIIILLIVLGLLVIVKANDLLGVYLGLELQSLGLYVLATFRQYGSYSTEAGLKYFILGAFSSGILLFGIAVIYGFSGITKLNEFYMFYNTIGGTETYSNLIFIGGFFVVTGLLFKIGAVPFHAWLPDVYQGAPLIVTGFFATVPKIVIIGLLLKVVSCITNNILITESNILVISGILSIFVGSLGALAQRSIKRFIAYSAINHTGYILLGIISGTLEGIVVVYMYITIYIIIVLNLFAVILSNRKQSSYKILHILGSMNTLYRDNKIGGIIACLVLFSLAGIPVLAGFFTKLYVFLNLIMGNYMFLAITLVFLSGIAAVYYLRQIKVIANSSRKATGFYFPVGYCTALVAVYGVSMSLFFCLGVQLFIVFLNTVVIEGFL